MQRKFCGIVSPCVFGNDIIIKKYFIPKMQKKFAMCIAEF